MIAPADASINSTHANIFALSPVFGDVIFVWAETWSSFAFPLPELSFPDGTNFEIVSAFVALHTIQVYVLTPSAFSVASDVTLPLSHVCPIASTSSVRSAWQIAPQNIVVLLLYIPFSVTDSVLYQDFLSLISDNLHHFILHILFNTRVRSLFFWYIIFER